MEVERNSRVVGMNRDLSLIEDTLRTRGDLDALDMFFWLVIAHRFLLADFF